MTSPKPLNFKKAETLVDHLRQIVETQNRVSKFIFLPSGEEEEEVLTYPELDRQARAIAQLLKTKGMQGERAVLLYAPGLEYIAGFFACLYGGVVAVPAYPPDPNRLERSLPRLQAIVKNCQAKKILTTESIKSMAQFFLPPKFRIWPNWNGLPRISVHWMRPMLGSVRILAVRILPFYNILPAPQVSQRESCCLMVI